MKKAITYGVSLLFTNLIIFLIIFFQLMFIERGFMFAVLICIIGIIFNFSLNYKKFRIINGKINISFFRCVVFDSIIGCCSFMINFLMVKYNYFNPLVIILPAFIMYPIIITNKKIYDK